MEQLTKNQAVATSQEAVQNQNEPQLRDENAHNDKSVHGVLNPTYQAGLRRDAVQPDIEAERKKRDEIEAGKSYCSRQIGRAVQQECRDRKSGSAGMPRPNSYADFCLKKKRQYRSGSRYRKRKIYRKCCILISCTSRTSYCRRICSGEPSKIRDGQCACIARDHYRWSKLFNCSPTTDLYTLSLRDALPI